MQVKVAYHQVDNSDALNQFVEDKISKLNKFIENKNLPVNWVLSKNGSNFDASVHIHAFGKDHHVSAESKNVYESVSMAADKLKSKLSSVKAKIARSVHN